MSEPIDYCTIFSGPNAGLLARVSYNSLFKVCDVTDINFHVIVKDISDDDVNQIQQLLVGRNVEWYRSPGAVPMRGPNRYYGPKIPIETADDVGQTADFIMRYCGYSRWCVHAHFDMVYDRDFVSLCRSKLTPYVGMLGQHERFLLLNREAYAQSNIKFRSIAGFVAVPAWPEPTHNQLQIRHKTHPRAKVDDALVIRGFDTGELLELEIASLGWVVDPLLVELREYITHFGGGGSYYRDAPQLTVHRDRAMKLIEERGL